MSTATLDLMDIKRDDVVEVTTASRGTARMRALSATTMGMDFLVVWVCTDAEYERARQAGEEPKGIPWPANAVRALETA